MVNFLRKEYFKMFKTENGCKTPEVVAATGSIRHTRKRGMKTLKRTLKEGVDLFSGFYGIGKMSVLEQSI